MFHYFLSRRQKSTEQQELERIEALQKEVAEQRKRNEASYKAALAGSEYAIFHWYFILLPTLLD